MTKSVKEILQSGDHSLVIENKGIHTFNGRGISDLYNVLNNRSELLAGATIADKIIGKGAAAIMILGGASAVYADIISSPALSLFINHDIPVYFSVEVSNIINRKGDGICPVEQLCMDCKTASECLPLIEQFMSEHN